MSTTVGAHEVRISENDRTPQALQRIDCDVHPSFRRGLSDLMPYLSSGWRKRVGVGHESDWAHEVAASHFSVPTNVMFINPAGAMRRDTANDGSTPAANPELVAEQLLNQHSIDRAVLLNGNLLGIAGLPDPDLAAALATAHNRWLSETWLAADERYRGVVLVAPQDPQLAVAEIKQTANAAGFVQIHVPMGDRLLGERHFYPIYEAANDLDMPISVHPNAIDGSFRTGAAYPGGTPTYYVEWHAGITSIFAANLISMVCHGVFERFPNLRMVIMEGGFAWLPDVLWRLDKNWRGLRDELPWLTKAPSEYIFERVRFTTQPFIEPDNRAHVGALCEMIRADKVLMFSTDYPHWDFDNPDRALSLLPEDLKRRVLVETALEFYGDRML